MSRNMLGRRAREGSASLGRRHAVTFARDNERGYPDRGGRARVCLSQDFDAARLASWAGGGRAPSARADHAMFAADVVAESAARE
jgi:hypothetical protein